MRTWIEKLANASKERGTCILNRINLDNLEWCVYWCKNDNGDRVNYLCLRRCEEYTTREGCDVKLYDDEFDLLTETHKYCTDKLRDKFINIINNLE